MDELPLLPKACIDNASLDLVFHRRRKNTIFEPSHKSVRLFRQAQGENRMGQYPRQMREISFVHGQKPFSLYSLDQTVENTTVQVSSLVVHP